MNKARARMAVGTGGLVAAGVALISQGIDMGGEGGELNGVVLCALGVVLLVVSTQVGR